MLPSCRMKATLQMLSPNYEPSDNNNFNLYPLGDDIVVAQESNIIHIIDPITLDTKDRVSMHKVLILLFCIFVAMYWDSGLFLRWRANRELHQLAFHKYKIQLYNV